MGEDFDLHILFFLCPQAVLDGKVRAGLRQIRGALLSCSIPLAGNGARLRVPAELDDVPTELLRVVGSVIYKYCASTRLSGFVISHKFPSHCLSHQLICTF